MLTPEDIKNLTEFQKTVFVTKDEFARLENKIESSMNKLQTSVDAIAKDNRDKAQEMPVVNRRLKDLENWVDKAAPVVKIKFQH